MIYSQPYKKVIYSVVLQTISNEYKKNDSMFFLLYPVILKQIYVHFRLDLEFNDLLIKYSHSTSVNVRLFYRFRASLIWML